MLVIYAGAALVSSAWLWRLRHRKHQQELLDKLANVYWDIVQQEDAPHASSGGIQKESGKLKPKHHEGVEFPASIVPDPQLEPDNEHLDRLGLKPGASWTQVSIRSPQSNQGRRRKLILLVRHAEAIHNVAEREVGTQVWNESEGKKTKYTDAPLNSTGRAQAHALRKAVNDALQNKGLRIDAIVLSPLARALETARIGLDTVWNKVPKVAVEHCRERFGICLSEKRRDASTMAQEYPSVDFTRMLASNEDSWHRDDYRETPEDIERRVHKFFAWLMETPWDHVAVVTHSDYIAHALQALGAPWHWPANAELVPVVVENTFAI